MSNALYDPGREGFLAGEIDFDTAVFKWILVRLTAGGAPVFTASQKFVSDLTATHTIAATSAALSGKTVTNGVADASDFAPAFSSVAANANNHVLVLIQSSAVTGGADVAATAQRLVGWYDTGTNLPIVPNGGDVNITHDNGANKIFKLVSIKIGQDVAFNGAATRKTVNQYAYVGKFKAPKDATYVFFKGTTKVTGRAGKTKCIANTPVKHVVLAAMGDQLGLIKGGIVNYVVRNVKKMVPAFDLPQAVRFNEAIARGTRGTLKRPDIRPDDVAVLQYTGGTTGVSKGAVLLHRNVLANVLQSEAWNAPVMSKVPAGEQTTSVCASGSSSRRSGSSESGMCSAPSMWPCCHSSGSRTSSTTRPSGSGWGTPSIETVGTWVIVCAFRAGCGGRESPASLAHGDNPTPGDYSPLIIAAVSTVPPMPQPPSVTSSTITRVFGRTSSPYRSA